MGPSKLCRPSPHKQIELSAPELEGLPAACRCGEGGSCWEVSGAAGGCTPCGMHRGLGSGVRQLSTHQPLVPCSLRTPHDDWWEEWRPIPGCSVPRPCVPEVVSCCLSFSVCIHPGYEVGQMHSPHGWGNLWGPLAAEAGGQQGRDLWCRAGVPVGCSSLSGLMFLSLMRCSPLLLL